MKCPICSSEGTLSLFKYEFEAKTVDKSTVPVTLEAYNCAHCGEEVETPEITKSNNIAVARAKADHYARSLNIQRDSIPEFIKAFRTAFDMTQGALTELFDSSDKAISKYELGSTIPSRTITKFIKLIIQRPVILSWLREMDEQEKYDCAEPASSRAINTVIKTTINSAINNARANFGDADTVLKVTMGDIQNFPIAQSLDLDVIAIETVVKSVKITAPSVTTPLSGSTVNLLEINTSTMTAH